jgi:hypothetical protein
MAPFGRRNLAVKVKDLISKLRGLDGELPVMCFTEDLELEPEEDQAFEIQEVNVTNGTPVRGADGRIRVRFDTDGPTLCLIEFTAD